MADQKPMLQPASEGPERASTYPRSTGRAGVFTNRCRWVICGLLSVASAMDIRTWASYNRRSTEPFGRMSESVGQHENKIG